MITKNTKRYFVFSILIIFFLLCALLLYINLHQQMSFPVQGATKRDYDQNSFGAPRVGHKHKGVDIFAPKGTPVLSLTRGFVLFTGVLKLGGNVVLILGPDFRMYYYAHLDKIEAQTFEIIDSKEQIGTVGKTGNARTTPPHLHFSISKINPFSSKVYYDPVPILNEILKAK
jgi:murein DD-endopeptidase MepM/ murein hydrolase activator NlpD